MRFQTTRGKDGQAARSKKNVWGVTNFLPAPEEEDDNIFIKTFIEWMKKQSMLHSSKRDTAVAERAGARKKGNEHVISVVEVGRETNLFLA